MKTPPSHLPPMQLMPRIDGKKSINATDPDTDRKKAGHAKPCTCGKMMGKWIYPLVN